MFKRIVMPVLHTIQVILSLIFLYLIPGLIALSYSLGALIVGLVIIVAIIAGISSVIQSIF